MTRINLAFRRRLDRVMKAGNLTLSDLARWLNRPGCIVWTWACSGRIPVEPDDGRPLGLYDRLRRLELAIGKRLPLKLDYVLAKASEGLPALPVPPLINRRQRKRYMKLVQAQVLSATVKGRKRKIRPDGAHDAVAGS